MSVVSLKPVSVEEYLWSEELSAFKREYVGGYVCYVYPLHGTRAQAGASRGHMLIALNILRVLDPAASDQGRLTYTADMKLRTERLDHFSSPDVMVVCGQHTGDLRVADLSIADLGVTYQTPPCLLVEVRSRCTAATDRLAKQVTYTGIASLQTYLIVEQTKRKVYLYQRAEGGWQHAELIEEGSIDIPCLGSTLTLAQICRALPL
ncbi:Uma2 family endonuclease [Deinococcus sp.]|uniref:Uma2 family endonuclease n=1 Tax=Deinococcus sp. TaxID=47478 RepID=UPI003C7A8ED9